MNYRMFTDRDMNEENFSMVEDITMEDDVEMPVMKGVHNHEMPMNETMDVEDMPEMYGVMPWEETSPMYGNMPMDDDMYDMDDMMPSGTEEAMYNMGNMMPCCMMNNMGVMPYMVELEEDEEDEKCDDDILDIVKKIEKHHPEILTVLSSYGIPYHIAIKIVRRIVRLSLKHK